MGGFLGISGETPTNTGNKKKLFLLGISLGNL
jgi:hypothetical protein